MKDTFTATCAIMCCLRQTATQCLHYFVLLSQASQIYLTSHAFSPTEASSPNYRTLTGYKIPNEKRPKITQQKKNTSISVKFLIIADTSEDKLLIIKPNKYGENPEFIAFSLPLPRLGTFWHVPGSGAYFRAPVMISASSLLLRHSSKSP